MIEVLNDLPVFVEVARQKSFTAAASILGVPLSTVSRRIATLEERLGVPLLLRNSRNVELTEQGKIFFDHCDYVVRNAEDACDALVKDMHEPAGIVRFAVPPDTFSIIFPCLDSFSEKWPDIELQVRLTTRFSDPIKDPFDVEFRHGSLPDSSLRMRGVGKLEFGLYAAPAFLEESTKPTVPEDVLELRCIVTSQPGREWLFRKEGVSRKITVRPAISLNSISGAMRFAKAGHGLAYLPQFLAYREERAGSLVRLLADWTMTESELSLVMPNQQPPWRVRLFIDHLVAFMEQLNQDTKADMAKELQ